MSTKEGVIMQPIDKPMVCLYEPEIPQNTGTIGRLVAGAMTKLHLIEPLGFSTHDRELKRAGLDYWPYLDVELHQNWEIFLARTQPRKMAFLSTKGKRPYTEIPKDTDVLVFGKETVGLPRSLWERYSEEQFFHIPIWHEKVRSFNLANAVSIVLYDQLMR